MNILIIGNGFDLAHGLPTTYSDFLNFINKIKMTQQKNMNPNKFKRILCNSNINDFVKLYLIEALKKRFFHSDNICTNKNPLIQELYDNLKNNIWFDFFEKLHEKNLVKGINWIDFESEISYIVEFIDRFQENIYLPMNINSDVKDEKVRIFIDALNSTDFEKNLKEKNKNYLPTFSDLIDKTYTDLRRFIRCMEIYFSDCVEKIDINLVSIDILQLNSINAILNFNYTHTFEKFYNMNNKQIHYIHGETQLNNDTRKNNMVLGIDEYRRNGEQNSHTNYNLYKKFTQRIINETGFKYRNWIKEIQNNDNYNETVNIIQPNAIFIFGHSLDITDKDIFYEFIMNEFVITIILYNNKQQQSKQISNLVKMIGQDNFINKINSVPPSIVFKKQQDMKAK